MPKTLNSHPTDLVYLIHMMIVKTLHYLINNDLFVPGVIVSSRVIKIRQNRLRNLLVQNCNVNYMQYNVKQCNNAMRVAGLAVFIVCLYSKPRVPAARIEHVCG